METRFNCFQFFFLLCFLWIEVDRWLIYNLLYLRGSVGVFSHRSTLQILNGETFPGLLIRTI